jgi:hypothetical protein
MWKNRLLLTEDGNDWTLVHKRKGKRDTAVEPQQVTEPMRIVFIASEAQDKTNAVILESL